MCQAWDSNWLYVNSTVKNIKRTQIGTSELKFSIVGEEVLMADSIRRPDEERVCVNRVNEGSVVRRKWQTGNRRIIKRKCGIESGDSAKRGNQVKL